MTDSAALDWTCPVLSNWRDVQGVLGHNWLFCQACLNQRLDEKVQGRELVFREAPPSWIAASEAAQKLAQNEAKPTTAPVDPPADARESRLRTRQQKRPPTSKKDETGTSADAGDGAAASPAKRATNEDYVSKLREYQQRGMSRTEAKRQLNIEHREKMKATVAEKAKEQVNPDEMPWQPTPAFKITGKSSVLSPYEHNRYVAIVSNFAKAERSLRFRDNAVDLQEMDERLVEERAGYHQTCLNALRSMKDVPYNFADKKAKKFILSRLATRVLRIGGAFQSTPLQRVPWLQDDSPLAVVSSSQPRLIATLLTGKSEVVAIPNCRRKCEFDRRCETVSRVFPEEGIAEDSLARDPLMPHFVTKHNLNLAITVSALKALLCDAWLMNEAKLALPVTVRRCLIEGRMMPVVVIDKPCSLGGWNYATIWGRFLKLVVKCHLLTHATRSDAHVVSAPKKAKTYVDLDAIPEDEHGSGLDTTANTSSASVPGEDDLDQSISASTRVSRARIPKRKTRAEACAAKQRRNDESAALEKSATINSTHRSSSAIGEDSKKVDNVFDTILNDIKAGERNKRPGGSTTKSRNAQYAPIEDVQDLEQVGFETPRRRYSIFDLDGIGHVLVRGNNDARVAQRGPVSLATRVEYLPQMGVSATTDEEWLENYVRAVFKCSDEHVTMRVHFRIAALLQVEYAYSSDFQDPRQISPERMALLSRRLRRLADLVTILRTLQPGRYLLERGEKEMSVLAEAGEGEQLGVPTLDLTAIASAFSERDIRGLRSAKDGFTGIDCHRVLVWQIVQKRIPASYFPLKSGGRGGKAAMEKDETVARNETKNKRKRKRTADRRKKHAGGNE